MSEKQKYYYVPTAEKYTEPPKHGPWQLVADHTLLDDYTELKEERDRLSDKYVKQAQKLERLKCLNEKLAGALRQHHRWQNDIGVVPEELYGIDMSAEYADSKMCNDTTEALNEYRKLKDGE